MFHKGDISRRRFIRGLALAGAAVSLLPKRTLGASVDSLAGKSEISDSTNTGSIIQINLQDPKYAALAIFGGAVYVDAPGEKNPIIVSRVSSDKVVAVSSTCTHKGCRLSLPKKGKFVCPCHKAAFDGNGKVTKGPAKTDLKVFRTEIVENVISILMK